MSSVLEPLTSYLDTGVNSRSVTETRPNPESYDSGEECSLARFVRVFELLEIEDRELDKCVFDDVCLHIA